MNIASGNAVISKDGDLSRLVAERTRLALAKLKLYKSSFIPTNQSLLADFVAAEADFSGYAFATLSWDAVGVDSLGNYFTEGSNSLFQASDALNPNTIGGAWIETATGTLVMFLPFDVPVNMTVILATLNITPVMKRPEPDSFVITY